MFVFLLNVLQPTGSEPGKINRNEFHLISVVASSEIVLIKIYMELSNMTVDFNLVL